LEVLKAKCTRRPTFNIHDAFATIDIYKKGNLNREDIKRFMQKNGFHPTNSELTWLCARFDRNL
jgi:Ca2+-binding EF-hand superfamily protein